MKKILFIFVINAILIIYTLSALSGCVQNNCSNHSEKWVTDIAATCTTQGIKHAECADCGKHLGVQNLPMLDHNFINNVCTYCGFGIGTKGLIYIPNIDKTGYIVKDIGTALDSDIIIPSTYRNLPVVAIANGAFQNTSITSVSIPDTIIDIEDNAFRNCSLLKKVIMSESIIRISNNAFDNCPLIQYNISNGLEYLGNDDNKFIYLSGIININVSTIQIENSCQLIKSDIFFNCINLQYNCSNGLQYLGNDNNKFIFLKGTINNNIKTAEIENTCKIINENAFNNCIALTSTIIPKSVINIGSGAFNGCCSLLDIYFLGTSNEWKTLRYGSNINDWNYVPATTIKCIDSFLQFATNY